MKLITKEFSHSEYSDYDKVPMCYSCGWVLSKYNFCKFSVCPVCGDKLTHVVGRYKSTFYHKLFLKFFPFDCIEESHFVPRD